MKKDDIRGCERTINRNEESEVKIAPIDVHNKKTRSCKITKESRGNVFCLVAFFP